MLESIITISVTALLVGFIFSMPIAGPISILITSNALKGRLRYCNLVALGASFSDFTYIFIGVFGLTKLYSLYEPAIPYILTAGSIIFFYLGYRIFRTKIDIEHLEDKSHLTQKIKDREKGAFYTGLMINFLNPTLFIGGLTSSFLVISFIASMGFHTGGLAIKMDQQVKELNSIESIKIDSSKIASIKQFDNINIGRRKEQQPDKTIYPDYFHLLISICYAFFLSLGTIVWFFLLSFLIVRFRQRINIKVISLFVKGLGVGLCFFALYFAYLAAGMFF